VTEWRWKTCTARLSWQPGEAGGSLTRETPGRAESRPDNAGTRWHCQTVRVRQARRKGVREKPAVKLLKRPTSSNLADMGLGCGAHRPV
jgi:hypothetical protein